MKNITSEMTNTLKLLVVDQTLKERSLISKPEGKRREIIKFGTESGKKQSEKS